MRRLFWLLILVAPCSAHAVNCSLTSGASQATVQAAIAGTGSNSCTGTANGTTVLFNAGNYTINYNTTVPCGATITGPVVPFTNPSSVTAHISGLVNGGWLFGLGCNSSSPTTTFQYLEYDAGRPGTRNPPVNVGSQSSGNLGGPCPGGPTDGGGFADLNAGTSNVTFQYNYIHGNQADFCSGPGGVYPDCGSGNGTCWGNDNDNDTFVWMEGDAGSQGGGDPGDYNRGIHDVNIFFYWNIFGASSDGTIANGDCSNIMQTPFYHGDRYDAIGGFCAAIGIHENTNNLQIANNVFQFQEQPVKIFEGCQQNYPQQTNCLADGSQFSPQINAIFNNNFVQYWHRIALENQGGPTPMDYISNVVILPQTAGGWGTWGFSTPSGPTNNDNNNYSWWQSGTVGPGMYEWWGNNGTLNNNFGQVEGAANNALFGFAGPPAFIQFDNWQNVNGTCAPPSYPNCQGGGWVGSEEGITQFPDFTGSTYTTNISSIQSAAPTISPTPTGTYSGTVSVTLSDAGAMNGGVGPQGHTTIYYTTNGSQPSASQTTNFCNANTTGTTSCTISVAAGSTVNALGMWGSINQPRSYPTNHGFTPSGVVSAHYVSSGGGTPTVNGIALGPSGSTITVGNSLQIVATCSYSDGSHTNCTTTDAFGNTASGWVSSSTTVATITSAGVLTARAAGSTNVTAAVGAFSSSPLAVTVNAAAPTLTGVVIADGGVGTISMGQTVQATATAQYNGGAITTNCSATPDAQGTVCNAWTSNTPAIASISSSGLITGVTQGTASMTVKATNGTTVFTSNPALSITVTSNTPPPATLTGVTVSFSGQTSVQAGNTISAAASCAYSDGTTTNCTTTDAHGSLAAGWTSSAPIYATINSTTGVATGVAAGTASIRASVGSSSVISANLQNANLGITTPPGWKAVCVIGSCAGGGSPGGTNPPASTSQTKNNATPSLSGASMLFSETTLATSTQTNALWTGIWGSCDTCSQFASDLRVYPNDTNASSLEFDIFNFDVTDNLDFMFGMQCNRSTNLWQISNQTSGWTNTAVSCASLASGSWHTLQQSVHRSGTNEVFDTITVDGVVGTVGMTLASTTLPGGFASTVGFQDQIDIGATTGTAKTSSVYVDEASLYASSGFISPPFALQVTPATAGNILGSNQFDFSGQNFPNNFVATYACAPSNPSIVSSMNLYLPAGSYPPSTPYDVIIVPALSSTTMASSAICSGGYTTTGTSTDVGWHAISPRGAGCGIIAANSCYWVGDVTTGSGVGQGYSDCDNGTASCNGAPPTNGNGTYHFGFNSVTFGTYTNMPAALTFSGAYQASVYAVLSTPNPTLTGGFLANQGTVNSLQIGQTAQFTASCSYSDGTSIQCFPTPDKYGNTATGFTSSNSSVIVVTNGGLATAVGTGAANVTATLTSSATSPWTITVSTPPNQAPPASGGRKRPKR